MRRFLDKLYLVSGGLAAVFTVGVLVAVVMSIVTRQLGVHIGGLDAYAGYSMAAAGFLALAHTFKSGEHIRVTLLLSALPAKGSRSEEHTSDLQSLMRISYAVFCLQKKKDHPTQHYTNNKRLHQ